MLNKTYRSIIKRDLFKSNIGGQENNANIDGNSNKIVFGGATDEQQTLIRKAGSQMGRILEGGTDIVTAPAKWLSHMQENWLAYLICITVLMVSVLFVYYCVRRKISLLLSRMEPDLSKIIVDDARKFASYRRGLTTDGQNNLNSQM